MRSALGASLGLTVALAFAPAAGAAPPLPFGHACFAQNGVRFCPTPDDSQRVRTFDGVPLDVDVTLPSRGDGPFPTILMLHGFPGQKTFLEAVTPEGPPGDPKLFHYNNNFYARQGYAVVNFSSRGFGRSCGVPDSRTAGCERGWVHLFDQRFEARDAQLLLGMLVDQRIAKATALGATGISQGGILTLQLAYLKDRVRLLDGRYARWRSPRGTPLALKAAYARWLGSDIVSALLPNGRLLDFRLDPDAQSSAPLGVQNQSFIDAIGRSARAIGFVAPKGADPRADIETWEERSDRGEPYGPSVRAIASELFRFHSPLGIAGTPVPLILQNGWTDDLFSPIQSLRVYNRLRRANPRAPVALQFGDLGHSRGSVKPNQERFFNDQAASFFGALLKGRGRVPAPGSATVFTQTCPAARAAGGPFQASSWTRLRAGALRFGSTRPQTVTSEGGNPETARAFNPNFGTNDACKTVPAEVASGTAVYVRRTPRAFTLLGLPTVTATISTGGRYGQLAARLWDVSPDGRQLLVTRGVYRLSDNQRGRIVFQLRGNGYRFERGHAAKLELLGSDPGYLRPSNGRFRVRVSALTLELPTRERLGR